LRDIVHSTAIQFKVLGRSSPIESIHANSDRYSVQKVSINRVVHSTDGNSELMVLVHIGHVLETRRVLGVTRVGANPKTC